MYVPYITTEKLPEHENKHILLYYSIINYLVLVVKNFLDLYRCILFIGHLVPTANWFYICVTILTTHVLYFRIMYCIANTCIILKHKNIFVKTLSLFLFNFKQNHYALT